MTGALVLRGDARRLPLADESVDLIITSPPYFGQRSYTDGGEHYDGQIGDEPSPAEYLAEMHGAMHDWWRVLKPTGSCFVNIGDKRSGSGAPGTTSGLGARPQGERTGIPATRNQADTDRSRSKNVRARAGYTREAFGRAKSRQALPERFVIGCEDGAADPDGIGWIYRQQIVWDKPNGMPESVKDRTRDNFEPWYHLTKDGDYYTAIDELRERAATSDPEDPSYRANGKSTARTKGLTAPPGQQVPSLVDAPREATHPLGTLPGSVWRISTEPLVIPKALATQHYAAFPIEWPRRLILGWSPPAICLECGQGRAPVVDVEHELYREAGATGRPKRQDLDGSHGGGFNVEGYPQTRATAQILGYACACTPYTDHPERRGSTFSPDADRRGGATGRRHEDDMAARAARGPVREYHLQGWTPPPSRPAVVLDPFGGTGTTAMVARALGRVGISVDLSADYCRVARWRIFESGHGAKAVGRTNRERQGTLL